MVGRTKFLKITAGKEDGMMEMMQERRSVPGFDFQPVKRCLFVAPHPDDNEIGAGGLIRYLLDLGKEVYTLVVTDGRLGGSSAEQTPERMAEIRRQETKAAAEALGVTGCLQLGFPDGLPVSDDVLTAALIGAIRSVKPDLVMTVDPHMRYECHPDHLRVGMAASTASMLSGLMYYPDGTPHETHTCMGIGYYFTDKPTHALDIRQYLKVKRRALECYESQLDAESICYILGDDEDTNTHPRMETFCMLNTSMIHCVVPHPSDTVIVLPPAP